MEVIGAFEAKTHLSQILDRVTRGEQFTITKHGHPVAVLQPVHPTMKTRVKDVIGAMEAFGTQHTTGDVAIRDMIDEGRR
ncbi:MAG: type II toxin-antitoxin system prevent-host-death family antitoxin [Magnetococcus sp. DMHC-1]|nr:type II toxin-antitoxin system prevent-host-death family antitoxin [Magnetococcales bacterium]